MLSVGQLELMSLPSFKEIITSIHTYTYIYGYIEYILYAHIKQTKRILL